MPILARRTLTLAAALWLACVPAPAAAQAAGHTAADVRSARASGGMVVS